MTEGDKRALLADICRWDGIVEKPPTYITSEDYAAQIGVSNTTARRRLFALVEAGRLQTALVPEDRNLIRIWFADKEIAGGGSGNAERGMGAGET